MTTGRGHGDSIGAAKTLDTVEVRSAFESIVADLIWHHRPKTESPGEILGRLLTIAPGALLMEELQSLDDQALTPDERLIYLHLWQRCSAWVNAQAADAAGGFIKAVTEPPQHRLHARAGVPVADEISLDEVVIATGLSTGRAATQILIGEAFAPDGSLADTGAAVRAGRISWDVATAFVDATVNLTNEQTRAVQDRVLPRAIRTIDPVTGEGCWRSRSWAVRELRRAVIFVDPDGAAKRREEARQRRCVTIAFEPDTSMAWVTAYLPAHQAIPLYDTLTAAASALRDSDTAANPDAAPRGWDTARADALIEVVRAAGEALAQTGQLPSVHGHTRIEVGVIIDLPTLLNLAHHPGEILGYGPIDPDYARLLAAEADTWRRWVIEPVTGHLLDYGRTRYRPTQELRDYILAAYPECSKPECDRHHARLEIDHVDEWHDNGPTSAANLHTMCWQDHHAKTNGYTQVTMNSDGTVTHTSRHGLTRTQDSYWRTYADHLSEDRNVDTSRSADDDIPPF